MRNLRLQIAYDGSAFFGWQRQDGFKTVQETIEDAVAQLTGEEVTAQGSGRTDTGVHALRQVANFHIQTRLTDDRFRHGINAHLPESVVVNRVETCPDDFHARFSAIGKRYAYVISTRRFKPSHAERQAAWCPQPLDFPRMERAARDLIGDHDFKGLSSTGGNAGVSTMRRVKRLRWIKRRDTLAFLIEAEGFLYNMVRAIAGTLVDVGRHRLPEDIVRKVLESGHRNSAGPTAPAGGLYLLRVLYEDPTFQGVDPGPNGTPGIF